MKTAYTPVTMYRTADGEVHPSEEDAQEHAEDKAGKALSVLLADVSPSGGQPYTHDLLCHLLRNHKAYMAALAPLQTYDTENGNDL